MTSGRTRADTRQDRIVRPVGNPTGLCIRRLKAAACLLVALHAASSAEAPEPQRVDQPVFRTETSLALVRFHVVNKKLYINNLKADDFELLEDGKPQKVALFEGGAATGRTVPVELILVFDTSGSVMQAGLLDAATLKRELLDAIPGASLSIYRFETRMRRLAQATRDFDQIRAAFAALEQKTAAGTVLKLDQHADAKDRKRGIGGSPIFEATMEAALDSSSGPSSTTRLLLIFSDGFPTSNTKPEKAAAVARDLGIPVYPVVLGQHRIAERLREAVQQQIANSRGGAPPQPTAHMHRLEMQLNEIQDFAELGEMTGGRSFNPRELNPDTLRQILQFMVAQVRHEYVAGYYPAPSAGQKKTRRIAVRLRSKEVGKLLGGTRALVR